VQGERATLAVTGINGEDLRTWLLKARGGARARPVEASLMRSGDGYNGTLVVAIGTPQ
jgi:general secretion pathway protein M